MRIRLSCFIWQFVQKIGSLIHLSGHVHSADPLMNFNYFIHLHIKYRALPLPFEVMFNV